ncbi:glycosyltransferase family 2 protein [Pollutibacter soli]|uniref:glycosyltransferase family 2 protein n=1 Tax=Pollutibacter soli TaxID=3034157 RepID=UPI0030141A86
MKRIFARATMAHQYQPAVSIIIATYNSAELLPECFASIASQTFRSIEIVIVDGGSTDDTEKLVRNFTSFPVIFHQEKDRGIYDALNRGTKLANGRWFYFMGSDDLLLPGFSQLAKQMRDPKTIYYGDSEPFHRLPGPVNFILLIGKFSKYRLAKHCMNHQVILYPAGIFKKYQYELKYKVSADYALNIRAWGDQDFRRKYVPLLIARYNVTGFSSVNSDSLFEKDKPDIIKESMGLGMYLRYRFKMIKKKILRN